MTRSTMIGILAALGGCAFVQAPPRAELAAGRWTGELTRDGRVQPLAFEIENDHGTYRGAWRSDVGVPDQQLGEIRVSGDSVSLETEKLVFAGHIDGNQLSGTVSQKDTNAREGKFSVRHDALDDFSPASEPSFPLSR